jgi:chemotaxis protein MotA
MAVALLTTLYGAILANLVFNPMAGKLKTRHKEENLQREMIMEGILSISKGENPRIIEEKLNSYLAPKDRKVSD